MQFSIHDSNTTVIATLIFLANKPTPDPIIEHLEFVGQLVSQKENYPGNVLNEQRSMPKKPGLRIIAHTGRSFYYSRNFFEQLQSISCSFRVHTGTAKLFL